MAIGAPFWWVSVAAGTRSCQWPPPVRALVGHAGAVLLRRCADRTGLTAGLGAVFPAGRGPGWWDRGVVLVDLAVSIVLGAVCMSDIDVLAHQAAVFGDPPSDSTDTSTAIYTHVSADFMNTASRKALAPAFETPGGPRKEP